VKTLAILRHAKSSWDDSSLSDFERPLNDRGRKAARRIGREMKHRKMRFDHVLASPAMRVRETLDGVADGYGDRFEVEFDERIYMASTGALLDIIRDMADNWKRPLLVGHNPGLEQLLGRLTSDDNRGLRDKVLGKYPTGALAVVELPADRWHDVEGGGGQIIELILPRELSD
jgi:phosphohistidine phosphatase